MPKTLSIFKKMLSNKNGRIYYGVYIVVFPIMLLIGLVNDYKQNPMNIWLYLATRIGLLLLVFIAFLILYRLINLIPYIKDWVQPFYRKPCKKCNHPFSIRDDLFRNHTGIGVRYTTCKKCGETHYALFDGQIHIKSETEHQERKEETE